MPVHAAVTFSVPTDGVSSFTAKRAQRTASSFKESVLSRSGSSFGLFLEGSFADLLDSHVSFALEVHIGMWSKHHPSTDMSCRRKQAVACIVHCAL